MAKNEAFEAAQGGIVVNNFKMDASSPALKAIAEQHPELFTLLVSAIHLMGEGRSQALIGNSALQKANDQLIRLLTTINPMDMGKELGRAEARAEIAESRRAELQERVNKLEVEVKAANERASSPLTTLIEVGSQFLMGFNDHNAPGPRELAKKLLTMTGNSKARALEYVEVLRRAIESAE